MEIENNRNHLSKRKRDDTADEGTTANGDVDVDLSLLEALESSQNAVVEAVDQKTLKKLVLAFERRLRDNLAARLKYPNAPDKFADSELELHEEIEKLKILAGAPELYPDLVNLNTIPSLLDLLTHDNTDIAIDVVSLLQDLTDEDVLEDNDEPAQILVNCLVENNVLESLVQNLLRLSESDPDEMAAVHMTLSTIENLIEVKPAVAEMVCERTKLMRWILGKIKVREFDSNKQYASEILAILLQNSAINQKRLGQMNGVDVVLQAVAMYKSRDPRSLDEEEMVENLFDCLCCLLMPVENKERFVNAEGVELMIIIMNQKKSCYGSAIRALDFAMTNYPSACERFVDVMGLKTAFPAFMGKIPASKNKKKRYKEELEERLISLVASLFGGIFRGSRRERLLSKFVENEYEKIDRLMELYMRYSNRVKAEAERLDELELDDLEMDEDEKYNRKLESGLYSLQVYIHLLQSGWSVFVSSKRLVAGDVFIFLRSTSINISMLKVVFEDHRTYGSPAAVSVRESLWQSLEEDMIPSFSTARSNWLDVQPKLLANKLKQSNVYVAGEVLKVDIGFKNPLQISVSISNVSLMCEHSARSDEREPDAKSSTSEQQSAEELGKSATRRTSPAEFIVPFDQYMESVKNNYSIGMRFKMRFEGEEAPEQSFM